MVSSFFKKATFFLVIILAPFQWLSLFQLFVLSVKPVHISLGLVGLAVIIGGNYRIWKRLLLGKFFFIYVYGFYLLWSMFLPTSDIIFSLNTTVPSQQTILQA